MLFIIDETTTSVVYSMYLAENVLFCTILLKLWINGYKMVISIKPGCNNYGTYFNALRVTANQYKVLE